MSHTPIECRLNANAAYLWPRHGTDNRVFSDLLEAVTRERKRLDNLPAHKVGGVRAAIEATGARLRLPLPYSPDFNLIELAFAKFKAHLRRAAARSIPELWDAIAATLPQFAAAECANYFTACGYKPD